MGDCADGWGAAQFDSALDPLEESIDETQFPCVGRRRRCGTAPAFATRRHLGGHGAGQVRTSHSIGEVYLNFSERLAFVLRGVHRRAPDLVVRVVCDRMVSSGLTAT